jgi:hypothetical protein
MWFQAPPSLAAHPVRLVAIQIRPLLPAPTSACLVAWAPTRARWAPLFVRRALRAPSLARSALKRVPFAAPGLTAARATRPPAARAAPRKPPQRGRVQPTYLLASLRAWPELTAWEGSACHAPQATIAPWVSRLLSHAPPLRGARPMGCLAPPARGNASGATLAMPRTRRHRRAPASRAHLELR